MSWWLDFCSAVRESAAYWLSPARRLPGLSLLALGGGDSEVQRRVAHQQFRTLMGHYPSRIILDSAGVALQFLVVWFYRPGWAPALWGAAAFSLVAVEAYGVRTFLRSKPSDDLLRSWEVRCGYWNWAMGTVWGAGFFVAPQHAVVQPYLALGSLLVVTSALNLHSLYRPSIVWMALPCALITALQQATFGRWFDVGVALVYLLAVGLLLTLILTQNTLITRVMVASEERLALLNELDQQRLLAHHANEAKTRFLASVSHDLRQPMHSMALLADTLSRGPTDQRHVVQQLGASVEAMSQLLHGLSYLPDSKSAGPMPPRPEDGKTLLSAKIWASTQDGSDTMAARSKTGHRWLMFASGLRQVGFDLLSPWLRLPGLSLSLNASPINQRIAHSQFRTFFETKLEGSTPVLAATIGAVLALWFFSPGWLTGIWGACWLLLSATVWFDGRRYQREKPADEALRSWEVRSGRLSTLQGILLGSLWFVWPDAAKGVGAPTPYIAMSLFFVIVVSMRQKTSYRPALSWFALPCVVLSAFSLVTSGPLYNAIHGVGFLAAVGFMIRWGWMQNALTTRSMQVAEERVQLLAELEAQRTAAQHAHEVKVRFLNSVSQDLQAPMQTIAALTGSLRLHAGDEADLLGQIRASVHAMDDMLAALLEVSRLDDGTLPLNVESLALDVMLKRVALQFSAQALAKGLDLRVLLCGAHALSDAFQLRRIVDNLVGNAIRYTTRGQVIVRCRTRANMLWLQVWDTGLGIARSDRQRIFDEFVRIAISQPSSDTGLGLGLSIVRRLAQRLNHPLVLRSRPGRGSLFAVGLVLDRNPAHTLSEANEEAALLQLLQGRLVLLIDDDATVLKSMQLFLRTYQCEILAAHSTSSALQVVDDCLRIPDLLLSDFRLGEADNGVQAITQVRALVDEAVPALLITADLEPARAMVHSLNIGVLAKPLQANKLLSALRACERVATY
jgi:two-component system, sensor histidine kinase